MCLIDFCISAQIISTYVWRSFLQFTIGVTTIKDNGNTTLILITITSTLYFPPLTLSISFSFALKDSSVSTCNHLVVLHIYNQWCHKKNNLQLNKHNKVAYHSGVTMDYCVYQYLQWNSALQPNVHKLPWDPYFWPWCTKNCCVQEDVFLI